MARRTNVKLVLVTCGKLPEARTIARSVVAKRLAACVNVLSAPVFSVYRWQGRVERGKEWLLIMKTTSSRLRALENEVIRLHSYSLPEFLVVGVHGGSEGYLRWVHESVDEKSK